MIRAAAFLLCGFLVGCNPPATDPQDGLEATTPLPAPLPATAREYRPLELPNLPENVRGDTLLVYTTHAIGNGKFVMAARAVAEKREGLRLILYRPRPDSSAEVLAVSRPAYDSQVMLPTYFSTGDSADGLIILANYGGLESWGQYAFWLKNGQFHDLGWIDVMKRDWKLRGDSLQPWHTNIAPFTEVRGADGRFEFTFRSDSVQLFDDLRGHMEVMLPKDSVRYLFDGQQMVLIVGDEARVPTPL